MNKSTVYYRDITADVCERVLPHLVSWSADGGFNLNDE